MAARTNNNFTVSQIAALAQAFNNSIATGQPINLAQVFQTPKANKTYNMNIADIEALTNSRLSKHGMTLKDYQYGEPGYGFPFKGVKGEDIPNFTKRFCYFREGWAGEMLCGLSVDPNRPALIATVLDDIDSDFMSEGNVQASSTYIKHPLSFHLFQENDLRDFDLGYCCGIEAKILTTEDEINRWFDQFDSLYPRLQQQNKMVSEAYKNVKEKGKPFKDIMKTYAKRTKEYKEARKNYEAMILNEISKITAVDQINNDF